MKQMTLGLIAMLAIAVAVETRADDKEAAKPFSYTVNMTGVTWGGCQAYVRAAFQKLDGIVCEDAKKDISIVNGKEKGTQVVTFKSTNGKLSKKVAQKAIGDKSDKFVVTSVKGGAKKTPKKKKDA